ncbi:hypothetical protein MCOR27_003437 [Pyricularia oryzae]|uniref:Transcriptional regulator Ngg1 n=2 Tax=Pyricularia oryzae TaxID=318829 RepID=G4MYM1_PYRO7|nr:transcriptional regulator Ngg1 [Pyricularia oryzae 70-15]KAH8836844.1 hypothetical protein MCOR01_010504 [Pyricularia oryzae]EHA54446.1 transcriptional regulator Ngg1 [Pyricularia oryzae 70-15]KAI6261022.1 hypothetical protein MCOR19_002679 [Pyricularia oryzae]KAI6283085.1 hypothetical protein MCOR27_003437 [Pyricularia oryzae]KAI6314472.1 hypothetical protein MCOR34_004922 [Pyricularia oryzae]
MPPGGSSQKGTGKKGAGAIARQRSRNTTPSSIPPQTTLPPVETFESEHFELKFDLMRNLTYEDLFEQGASSSAIPDARNLDGISGRLQKLQDITEKRGAGCDRGMRLLAGTRRDRMDERAREEEEERLQREADEDRRATKKRRKDKDSKEKDSLAPQETNIERSSPLRDQNAKARKASREDSASSLSSPREPTSPTAMDLDEKKKTSGDKAGNDEEEEEESSEDEGAPPPRPVPQNQTFGEDPSTFPDPTVYEILPVKPGMSHEEICEIYSVATYPPSDLADLIAGDPPDKDFTNGKVTNQISFSTFSTYLEPYFRPFNEEDLTFLRERGDRSTPFIMPKRGKRHYTEIWAEEDGAMNVDSGPGRDRLPTNQPRGNIDQMNDNVAETDKLSVGPLLSRLLCAMRPEGRTQQTETEKPPQAAFPDPGLSLNGDLGGAEEADAFAAGGNFELGPNGELVMVGGPPPAPSTQPLAFPDTQLSASNLFDSLGQSSTPAAGKTLPPATFMAESSTDAWKKASHPKLDYSQVDERLKQELRHIGFLPLPDAATAATNGGGAASGTNGTANTGVAAGGADPSWTADYDAGFDDEVAARLRLLQSRLREQMLVNGARKARLMELVRERMAHQEYTTILEDLDTQVQQAYLKRTRTMGKGKAKKNRPVAVSAAMARPGIGDHARTLMERRRRWIENIGPIFEDDMISKVPRSSDPGSTIFQDDTMSGLIEAEKDAWDEEADEEE